MASNPTSEPPQAVPQAPAPSESAGPSLGRWAWLMAQVDRLISEPLRASPPVLARARLMVAWAGFMMAFTLLYLVGAPFSGVSFVCFAASLSYLVTLVLARRATSLTAPATLLTMTVLAGFLCGVFLLPGETYASTHAVHMLLPVLTVYLLGPRWALPVMVPLLVGLTVLRPLLHVESLPEGASVDPHYWPMHLFAAFSLVGVWALSALSGTERDRAQARLERTLEELRDSEERITSVFESTDDVVLSLDLEGRLLTANTTAREVYRQRYGREPVVGQPLFPPSDQEALKLWGPRLARVMAGERLRIEEEHQENGKPLVVDVRISPIQGKGGRITGVTFFSRDITARKQAETRLGEMHRTLVDVSRQAGMAEIATGVLHNVGNTLNSVNVSTGLLADQLRKSRVTGLAKATELLREHAADLGTFLTTDPQGKKLPAYLIALSGQLQQERELLLQELSSLSESVDHIKSIVSMQQKHARIAGTVEPIPVAQLIDEALRLHAVSFERLGISIAREYTAVPPLVVDRHKLLQILVNLLSNARHALVASERDDKRLTIRVRPAPEGRRLHIEVEDNGVGIAPENLSRMFTQGFTTKKTGHGFGLHISALAANEMEGQLTCTSPGLGLGATFTLELPMESEEMPS